MSAVAFRYLNRLAPSLWSGFWINLAGLALFAALWQAGNEKYGDFILASPAAVFRAIGDIAASRESWLLAEQTILRALEGYLVTLFAGVSGGLAAGYFPAFMRLSRPILVLLLGVPPIAWIVLTMIWFGSSDGAVIVTVAIACAPLLFVTAAEGVLTRDPGLDEMARAFGVGPAMRLWTIGLRHVASFLLPILSVSLGSAIKVAVMAEVLSNVGGMGGALATSRANLDIAGALAWVLIAAMVLAAVEFLVLRPLQSWLERWRQTASPWGIRR